MYVTMYARMVNVIFTVWTLSVVSYISFIPNSQWIIYPLKVR